MLWQAVTSIAALVTGATGAALALAGWYRSAKAEDAKSSADASKVGLEYLERALSQQQDTITHQQGQIGELAGQLKECRDERLELARQIEELKQAMP